MSSLTWMAVLAVWTAAPVPDTNPLLKQLQQKGVPTSAGSFVKLPSPSMEGGLDAEAQRKVLATVVGSKRTPEDLLPRSPQAPTVQNVRSTPTPDGGFVHSLDLWFVAYGDWNSLASRDFLEGLLRSSQQEDGQSKATLLSAEELAKRNIQIQAAPGLEEHYLASSSTLLDRVEVTSTQHAITTRGPDWLVVASQVDPRFTGDKSYPNEWRPLIETDSGDLKRGEPHPYITSGFYVQVTRLAEPAGAMFIEYHMVFEEPKAWFGGRQQLRSKLSMFVQDEARKLRRRLAARK